MQLDKNHLKNIAIILLTLTTSSLAEEGGSGHYLTGSMSSFVDGVPSEPSFIIRLNYLNYNASSDITIPKGSGGVLARPDARVNALGLSILYAPDWNLGEKWQFAISSTISGVNFNLSGDLNFDGVSFLPQDGTRSGLGDLVIMPLMINYNVDRDLNINARVGLYAPTGSYEYGRFINTGKNFWTIEPTVGIVYFGQENGREASLYFGADFNEENSATHYKSGTQLHLDGTLAQHFPWLGGISGVGVSGYWYKQVSDDSGEGATLGAFRAEAVGVGPVVSWIDKKGKYIFEMKYIKDIKNEKRLDADTLWVKYIVKF